MFYCQITGKLSRRGDPRTGPLEYLHETKSDEGIHGSEKLEKIVVATRERIYTAKFRNEETGKWEDVEIGRGTEIVREVQASAEGLAIWNQMTPEQRATFEFYPATR